MHHFSKDRIIGLPVAFAAAFLLNLLWIHVKVTGFGKVAGQVFFRRRGAISEAAMVAVVVLLGASH
jgi:hypothetical protein